MSSEIAIKVENLSKCYQIYEQPRDRLKQFVLPRMQRLVGMPPNQYYREFWAVKDVSFDVKKGETVGIIGRNGCGKSTLLQIITGTLAPTSGSVSTQGRIAALLELGSGFNPDFTGRENVYLNASILGMTNEEVDDCFDQIAAFADIGKFIDSPVKHYSTGMFARLAFSVAIHVNPEILIVDEILAVGDAAFQRRCLAKFYDIRERGCTVLFVSHDQYQVKSVCQRALYLEGGCQKMFGPAGRVIDAYTIDMEAVEAARAQPDKASLLATATVAEMAAREGEEAPGLNPSAKIVAPAPAVARATNDGCERPYLIESVQLLTPRGVEIAEVETGAELWLEMRYRALTARPPERISFVFNMYRHDDLYVCGTTTLMDGIPPFTGSQRGRVRVRFPSLPLLSGAYKFRVAINDHGGFVTLAEAKDACKFSVVDTFNAVGLVDLTREWHVETD